MPIRRRVVLALVSVLALVVAIGVVTRLDRGSPGRHEAEGAEGAHAMKEALEKHPGLARNRMALAYVAEKLEQQGGEGGGEAGGEINSGPSQESYDQRAFPRTAIGDAQRRAAASAYAAARQRGRTAAGGTVQRRAAGQSAAPTWGLVGPKGGVQVAEATYTGTPAYVSGRSTALTPGATCNATTCELFLATAGGGIWRTANANVANPTWTNVSADIPSTAIGSLYRAPNGTLFAGTGEPNGSSDSEAGVGLYKSRDDGKSWTRVSTLAGGDDFTIGRSVSAVAVDPSNAQHLLVGTAVARHGSSSVNGGRFTPPGAAKVGLYESKDAGRTWSLALSQDSDVVNPTSPTGADFFRGGISKIVFDPTHAGIAFASMFDYGLYRNDRSGAWRPVYTIKTPGAAATSSTNRVEFALATRRDGHTRVYLGDATYFGNATAALLRSDDALAAEPDFTLLSDPTPGTPGYGSYNFCETQCSYDMVVTSPPGKPNEVFLSGSMNYDELQAFGGRGRSNGRSIVRSDDAGVHVTDMTNDAKRDPNGLHPDQHALVFANTGSGPEVFFSASDGGVWRQAGPYVDRKADCGQRGLFGPDRTDCEQFLSAIPSSNQSLNKGLSTLQFQSVTVDGTTVQGGTQDNGTWESDYQGFAEVIGGDGGQSGFDTDNRAIRYHTYFGTSQDVSFDNGTPRSWDFIGDPFDEASSFYMPSVADPVTAGTVFDGLQHVWRTLDHGGDRAYLDKYCNEVSGDYGNKPEGTQCGDWVPLGGAAGDLSGGDTANYVVAVERSTTDSGTMWAATRKGGLYVTTNADAADPAAVTFRRVDQTLNLPKRFVSGISIDPDNPGHVFLSYSGYSAYSPGGHVYEVTVDPATGQGNAADRSANLGDQPITDVVYLPSTGALYAGTDYGVVTLAKGGGNWVATPGLPAVATYGLTLAGDGSTLYAATHGRSVWKLPLGG